MLAENALTTLERMKLMLGLSDIEDEKVNLIVELLINKASSWIERQTGRHLGKRSYHQWYDADGQQELVTVEYPIISVEYVKEEGRLVNPNRYDYSQTGDVGVIYRDEGWLKAGYRKGLAYDIVAPKRVIEVSYTAGYILPKDATDDEPQTLPADLEGLVWDMVSQAYTNLQNGSQGLSSFSISDVTWNFDKSQKSEWMQLGGVDSEVLKIAIAHEYGTEKLPERSFIRASFDADQAKLGEIVSGAIGKVLSGQTSADAAANAIGAQAAQMVQNFIDDNRVKPQSDFTKKTQHTTLYETGTHIRDRITYKVEEV